MRSRAGPRQLQVRAFQTGDLAGMTLRADFARELALTGAAAAEDKIASSWAFTMEQGADLSPRRVLAVAGVRQQAPGWWTVWCLASDMSPRGWAMVAHTAMRLFDFLEETMAARHIEMLVRLDNAAAARIARRMGFAEVSAAETAAGQFRVMVREQ